MYSLGQIFTATELVKHYRMLTKLLSRDPQPLLITHKNGERFVFVNAEVFDDLLRLRFEQSGALLPDASIREQLFARY